MIKNIAKALLPESFRRNARAAEKRIRYLYRELIIGIPVFFNQPMKVIVGAALTYQNGWYSTNEQWLDITRCSDWKRVFRGKVLLTHVVAEHVFEHLSKEECQEALRLISQHMNSGGRVRIAVPDGYHPDHDYIRHVGIHGIGADAFDHKQLLNVDSLSELLQDAGFRVEQLEGYLKDGTLVQKSLDADDGYIQRSRSNPINMAGKAGWGFVDANTSLIVDGLK